MWNSGTFRSWWECRENYNKLTHFLRSVNNLLYFDVKNVEEKLQSETLEYSVDLRSWKQIWSKKQFSQKINTLRNILASQQVPLNSFGPWDAIDVSRRLAYSFLGCAVLVGCASVRKPSFNRSEDWSFVLLRRTDTMKAFFQELSIWEIFHRFWGPALKKLIFSMPAATPKKFSNGNLINCSREQSQIKILFASEMTFR